MKRNGELTEKAWKQGTPLALATCFVSSEAKKHSEALRDGYPPESEMGKAIANIPRADLRELARLALQGVPLFYSLEEHDVTWQLRHGTLVGFGFKLPREPTDSPVRIPRSVWSGKPNFRDDSVVGAGFSFVEVRVLQAKEWAALASSAVAPKPATSAGRPGYKREIFAALSAEHKASSVCAAYREPGRARRIRSRLTEMYSEKASVWRDLDDDTINKYRRQFCEEQP